MKQVLILGAGKSANVLIDYAAEHAAEHGWHVTIADLNTEAHRALYFANEHLRFIDLKGDDEERDKLIDQSDIVVSMLPAAMHPAIAFRCLHFGKHLITPSYISHDMQQLHAEAAAKKLLFLNEMGLDPGIDHMSARQMIDEIKNKGGKIESFKSYCGGLVAPESDTNPWHYKFSWNPRNVVLAGQGSGGIMYREEGTFRFLPYHQLFATATNIEIQGAGTFEGYANRDSLKYAAPYGIEDAKTILRGTLRQAPFCKGWNAIVQLGMTDDTLHMPLEGSVRLTDFLNAFLPPGDEPVRQRLLSYTHSGPEILPLFDYLGFFNTDALVEVSNNSAAQVLQKILEPHWALAENDHDMIVMHHEVKYMVAGKSHCSTASMVIKGESKRHTAMAKTVGLPIALSLRYVLNNNWKIHGVQMPIHTDIYRPILAELESMGIGFKHETH